MTPKRYNVPMSTAIVKTTIYLTPTVKKYLQHKAVEEDTSISDLVNERIEEEMASSRFVALIEKRSKEPTVSFEDMMRELGLTYDDLRD